MSVRREPAPPAASRPPLLSVEQAQAILLEQARPFTAEETLPLGRALGRVLAAELRAVVDVPGFDNSAMDGYAVRAADAAEPGARLRVTQRIQAGRPGVAIGPGEAARIFTGAAVPSGADAIAIQEDCEADGEHVRVKVAVRPGEWVRPRGNNIAAGSVVLAAGTVLRAQGHDSITRRASWKRIRAAAGHGRGGRTERSRGAPAPARGRARQRR